MLQKTQRLINKNIYITRWINETERYVKYDSRKQKYLKVDLDKAQQFDTREEAEEFAGKVSASGFEKPEIVSVEVKTIA